jgi:hypothetical protein
VRHCCAATCAALLLGGTATSGQSGGAKTACTLPPATGDSVHVVAVVAASVLSNAADDGALHSVPDDALPYVVEAVRMHFSAPATLPLPVIADTMPTAPEQWQRAGRTPRTPPFRVTRLLAVDAYFTIDAHGPPRDIVVAHTALADPLEESMRRALLAVRPADYGLLPPDADGTRIHIHLGVAPADYRTEQPFFATWLTAYRLDRAPAIQRQVQAIYPPDARQEHVSDSLTAQFVVDETGHAVPGSITITRARYRAFIDAVAPAILNSEYQPAMVNGCPVKYAVQQAFIFDPRR